MRAGFLLRHVLVPLENEAAGDFLRRHRGRPLRAAVTRGAEEAFGTTSGGGQTGDGEGQNQANSAGHGTSSINGTKALLYR